MYSTCQLPRTSPVLLLTLFLILLTSLPGITLAQESMIQGDVYNESGEPLGFATVTLLYPSDSTLAFYGITNVEGHFVIKKTSPGEYLMQVGYLGHQVYWREVTLPLANGNTLEPVVLQPVPLNLREVNVNADRIPFLIKQDTIEYDAAAFRTKPDAVAEDLIRKLPGIEVDRVGNIKALGENVRNVLVDGKEFFSSDPKVATKNLPAGAIKKVQVYNKKSDQSELTGISDAERNQTVNLVLKDDQKKAWFGDFKAGGGTGAHYQANAKAYRFTDKNQFAVLGMINNINQFGFSFQDYLDFSGGLQSLMSGGNQARITISDESTLPINFGQPLNGLVTSGAGGINYSHEPKPNNRFNVSYLGNGAGKSLNETTHTENFTPGSSFLQDETSLSKSEDWNHKLNFGWRNKSDSMHTTNLLGNVALTQGTSSTQTETQSFTGDTLMNMLNSITHGRSNRLSSALGASWMRKGRGNWKLFKISGEADYSNSLSKSEWENVTRYLGSVSPFIDNQYLHSEADRLSFSLGSSVLRKIGKNIYLEPDLQLGGSYEWTNRTQGIPGDSGIVIDSLSPVFDRSYQWLRPALSFKRNTKKTQLTLTAGAELGRMANTLADTSTLSSDLLFFTPGFSWEYEYKTGSRLTFYYSSSVNTPLASQLLPVVNNRNPLYLFSGNRSLKPEYRHDLFAQWFLYDAFSFTSLFISLNGAYTNNKISYARTVNDSLGQMTSLINVPDDYSASLRADFSTPIRKLGLNVHLGVRESWNKSATFIDSKENINTNWNHAIKFSVDNRRKEKWDVSAGVEFDLTNARYTVQESLNTDYFNLVYFGEIRFTPNDRWHFLVGADVTNYNAQSFNDAVSVPLLRAEINFYFLKNNRMMLTLSGSDLLNRNKGIQRVSEQNYLRETHSNTIGRYVILALKFRLNKFGGGGSGISIKTK
ncbi:MAG: outer membrane beta-barrel protein [Bacteroidales bacterium]|nr:outer membrane beta-barrel protein [Bacteroidales bacterium]